MTDLRKAAEMALEALKGINPGIHMSPMAEESWNKASDALRQALAQSEHEPVAWAYPEFFDGLKNNGCWTVYEKEGKGPHRDGIERTPLYTAPPKKEWVGLTDDEIEDAWIEASDEYDDTISINNLGRILEAKLKEKNG